MTVIQIDNKKIAISARQAFRILGAFQRINYRYTVHWLLLSTCYAAVYFSCNGDFHMQRILDFIVVQIWPQ